MKRILILLASLLVVGCAGKYVGDYKDGKYHGQGTYTFADGRKYVGEFKDGFFWTGFLYDSDGNVLSEYLDDAEIKQE